MAGSKEKKKKEKKKKKRRIAIDTVHAVALRIGTTTTTTTSPPPPGRTQGTGIGSIFFFCHHRLRRPRIGLRVEAFLLPPPPRGRLFPCTCRIEGWIVLQGRGRRGITFPSAPQQTTPSCLLLPPPLRVLRRHPFLVRRRRGRGRGSSCSSGGGTTTLPPPPPDRRGERCRGMPGHGKRRKGTCKGRRRAMGWPLQKKKHHTCCCIHRSPRSEEKMSGWRRHPITITITITTTRIHRLQSMPARHCLLQGRSFPSAPLLFLPLR